jgi:hypothetical protein
MRLRQRHRNLVVWSSSAVPGRSWAWRPARPRRIRWWLRTTSLLAVIGVMRLARTARARWEPVSLAIGGTLTGIGFALPAAAVAYLLGLLILIVALITGIAAKGRAVGQAADCWQWRG